MRQVGMVVSELYFFLVSCACLSLFLKGVSVCGFSWSGISHDVLCIWHFLAHDLSYSNGTEVFYLQVRRCAMSSTPFSFSLLGYIAGSSRVIDASLPIHLGRLIDG